MKKNIFISIVCLCTILLMTGCSKIKIDSNKFKSISEESGFTVINQTNDDLSSEIKEYYIASKVEDFNVFFQVFENDEFAKKTFDSKKDSFNNIKVKKSESSAKSPNYDKYVIIANDRFNGFYRVDNTLIYINTSESNKNEAKELIKKYGY